MPYRMERRECLMVFAGTVRFFGRGTIGIFAPEGANIRPKRRGAMDSVYKVISFKYRS